MKARPLKAGRARRLRRHVARGGVGRLAQRVDARQAASPRYRSRMAKWEYVTVPLLVHATKEILDNWGDDGWELVAVVPGPNTEQLVAYMKRERS